MPPLVPVLAQSENKSKFLERLGISQTSEDGKRIYNLMKEEAIAGRARMSASPISLLPELINDPDVRPPYSNTQISEGAMHQETLRIYNTASPDTRSYYDLGHYTDGGIEDNWVIRWLLWHVFRYRDNRNRGSKNSSHVAARATQLIELHKDCLSPSLQPQSSPTRLAPMLNGHHEGSRYPLYRTASAGSTQDSDASDWRSSRASLESGPDTSDTESQKTARPSGSQGYWDPVRDAQRNNDRRQGGP